MIEPRRHLTRFLLSVALFHGGGCASAAARSSYTPPPPCADSAVIAAAQRADSTTGLTPPRPLFLPVPPVPVPEGVRGQVVRLEFRLDSLGRIAPAGLNLRGTSDERYNAALRARFSGARFTPAIYRGCAVSGTAGLVLHLE
jgi:hypothetical protein